MFLLETERIQEQIRDLEGKLETTKSELTAVSYTHLKEMAPSAKYSALPDA